MQSLLRFLGSTVGAKFLMALTGVLLALFVVGHLSGNFLLYKGQDAMNDYAEMLQGLGPALWIVRLGLLAVFATHIYYGIRLKRRNAAARPVNYAHEDTIQASFASRSMILTGLVVLAFVAMHLAHFTLGWLDAEAYDLKQTVQRDGQPFERHDVFGMVVAGFHNDVFVILYAFAMVVLGLHLSHGLHSLFQTLGFRHPAYTPWIERIGRGLAWVLAVGFLSIPLAVRFGFIAAAGGGDAG